MRMLKVTDYIVEFLISKGITQAFGYPGGSSANLVNSFYTYREKITAHITYHEQAAAFAACGYAQTSGKPGVVYSIGGPGATNLITGIGHAYFDSIPLICLTGNVNTYESAKGMRVRQRAFQECEILSVVKPLTKYCAYVEKAEDIRYYLEKAYVSATEGRPGPVLLDIPMNISSTEMDVDMLKEYIPEKKEQINQKEIFSKQLVQLLDNSERPVLILGNGVKKPEIYSLLNSVVNHLKIPYVTSMIAFDVLTNHPLGYGFLGASGSRSANFIAAKSDLIISLGSRLDIRQVGVRRENFAPEAKIIRVDIDPGELEYKLHEDEISFCMDVKDALEAIESMVLNRDYAHWREVCETIREKTKGMDMLSPNLLMQAVSRRIPQNAIVTTDVGQNQVWTAQCFELKENQKVLFSGGFGAMGHALPAAIGAYYGSCGRKAVAIAGDGGLQMNIQELQYIAREKIPVKVIVFNNHALGMIRHFQEVWFEGIYFQTKPEGGFTSPSFKLIAEAYGIDSIEIYSIEELTKCETLMNSDRPALIEIHILENTYEYPKLRFGSPNQDQEPLMDRKLFKELMDLR